VYLSSKKNGKMLPPNSTRRKCKNLINGEPMNPNICVKRWIYNEIRDLWHHGSRNRTYLWNHDSWVQAQFVDLNLLYTDPKRAIAQSQNYESKDLWIERATYIEISVLDVRFTDKSPNLIGVQRSQKAKESLRNRRFYDSSDEFDDSLNCGCGDPQKDTNTDIRIQDSVETQICGFKDLRVHTYLYVYTYIYI